LKVNPFHRVNSPEELPWIRRVSIDQKGREEKERKGKEEKRREGKGKPVISLRPSGVHCKNNTSSNQEMMCFSNEM